VFGDDKDLKPKLPNLNLNDEKNKFLTIGPVAEPNETNRFYGIFVTTDYDLKKFKTGDGKLDIQGMLSTGRGIAIVTPQKGIELKPNTIVDANKVKCETIFKVPNEITLLGAQTPYKTGIR